MPLLATIAGCFVGEERAYAISALKDERHGGEKEGDNVPAAHNSNSTVGPGCCQTTGPLTKRSTPPTPRGTSGGRVQSIWMELIPPPLGSRESWFRKATAAI